MLQKRTTVLRTTQSKYGRRFDEGFKREVAALASQPGATNEQVGRDLGISPWSVSRWRRAYAPTPPAGTSPGPTGTPVARPSASVQELERQVKALQRENADLREQRTILKKAVAIFSDTPR